MNRAPEPCFTAREIVLRYVLLWACLSAPIVALMYLPARWAVSVALLAGYEARTVVLVFGAPFQSRRDANSQPRSES